MRSLYISNSDMRRFLFQSILFALLVLSVRLAYEAKYFYSGEFGPKVNGSEIYAAKRQSRMHHFRKKLLFGDSVAMQLFPSTEDSDSLAVMTCNQAISMAGVYFLLTDYLSVNADSLPDEVVLLIHPESLNNDLDRFSYHYFLKPFQQHIYADRTSEYLKQRIACIPWYWTAQLPFFRSSNYSVEYTMSSDSCFHIVSPLSKEYITRIVTELDSLNIRFRMRSVPIRESLRESVFERMEHSIEVHELPDSLMLPFYESIELLPDSMYQDRVHFTHEALPMVDASPLIR